MAHELTEQRIKKPNVRNFLETELQKLVMRRRTWWRKQILNFNTTAGTATYDLTAGSPAIAPFFHQAIKLYNGKNFTLTSVVYDARGFYPQAPALVFLDDSISKMRAISDVSTQGPPGAWFIQPGTTKTLRLSPIPDASYPIVGDYWTGYIPAKDSTDEELPSYFPHQYDYVVLAALLKRMTFYLWGAEDPRAALALQDYNDALSDLDSYKFAGVEAAPEFRHSDPNVWVGSTS